MFDSVDLRTVSLTQEQKDAISKAAEHIQGLMLLSNRWAPCGRALSSTLNRVDELGHLIQAAIVLSPKPRRAQ